MYQQPTSLAGSIRSTAPLILNKATSKLDATGQTCPSLYPRVLVTNRPCQFPQNARQTKTMIMASAHLVGQARKPSGETVWGAKNNLAESLSRRGQSLLRYLPGCKTPTRTSFRLVTGSFRRVLRPRLDPRHEHPRQPPIPIPSGPRACVRTRLSSDLRASTSEQWIPKPYPRSYRTSMKTSRRSETVLVPSRLP